MTKEDEIAVLLTQLERWWDENEIYNYNNEDPPGEVMYDAYVFIKEIMDIRKREC